MNIIIRIYNEIRNTTLVQLKNQIVGFVFLNSCAFFVHLIYVYLRYPHLNLSIPFWYGREWGELQLAPRGNIFILPMLGAFSTLMGLALIIFNRLYIKYFDNVVFYFVFLTNIILSFASYRIIQVASGTFTPLVNPVYTRFIFPFIVALVLTYIILPVYISFAQKRRIITNPSVHAHPGMILKQPSARGAGIVYSIVVVVVAGLLIGFKSGYISLFVSLFMLSLLGFLDDIQQTLPSSGLKFLENPVYRLFLMFLAIVPYVMVGNTFSFISIPFVGVSELGGFSLNLGPVLSTVITMVWIVWVLNVLSWSNGIDGQYAGIIGIGSLIIMVLSLRFSPLKDSHWTTATLAAISAGAAFGTVRHTWFPSKVMWGFSAVTAGLVLAAMSISVQSKIVISFLVIIVPFLDGLVTVVRRLLMGKSPFSGDRGHLHHLLLDRGFSPRKIALFYWVTTAIFGGIGLLSSEGNLVKVSLICVIIVSICITALNWLSLRRKPEIQLFD